MMRFTVNPEGQSRRGLSEAKAKPHKRPCASEAAEREGGGDLRPHQSPVPTWASRQSKWGSIQLRDAGRGPRVWRGRKSSSEHPSQLW